MKEKTPNRKRKLNVANSEPLSEENDSDNCSGASSRLNSSRFVSTGSNVFTFVLLIITLLIYDMTFLSQKVIDIQAIKSDLLNNVHNQTDTVNLVLDSLNQIHNHEQNMQIINFIGSTGVGKTFIASILKRHFSSVCELNAPLPTNTQQIINNLRYSSYNLIIVDDLVQSDVNKLLTFLKEIPRDLVALVICIFNIQETDDALNHRINYSNVDKIIQKFNESDIPHKVAKFHEFDKNQAKDWVMKQLIKKGINFDYHSNIIESILSEQDVRFHGLKGLSSKINLRL